MKTASMIAATAAALLLTCTFGCGPAAPTNVDTSTSSSNTVGELAWMMVADGLTEILSGLKLSM